jgi:protocatechuate 3,4-dioxygenase, alpha subunit
LGQTPSQTAGPFFAYGLTPKQYGYPFASIATGQMADEMVAGERIRIIGQVLDGEGSAIADALIELWQADAQGHYVQPSRAGGRNTGFCGFGRQGTGTDPENRFIFDTIKPGRSMPNRRPTSASSCSCAGFSPTPIRGSIFPTKARPTPVTRC